MMFHYKLSFFLYFTYRWLCLISVHFRSTFFWTFFNHLSGRPIYNIVKHTLAWIFSPITTGGVRELYLRLGLNYYILALCRRVIYYISDNFFLFLSTYVNNWRNWTNFLLLFFSARAFLIYNSSYRLLQVFFVPVNTFYFVVCDMDFKIFRL